MWVRKGWGGDKVSEMGGAGGVRENIIISSYKWYRLHNSSLIIYKM